MKKEMVICSALAFANEAHMGQTRKGTNIPYITHPVAVMDVMGGMGLASTDPNLVAAGLLHDVVEDTDVTLEEIREKFGDDVAALVASHTEDKGLSWNVRKQQLIDELETGDDRFKMLIMADATANLRSLERDVCSEGETVWTRFNAPKEKQRWYYTNVVEGLKGLAVREDTAPVYEEMVKLLGKVFPEGKQA